LKEAGKLDFETRNWGKPRGRKAGNGVPVLFIDQPTLGNQIEKKGWKKEASLLGKAEDKTKWGE